MADNHTVTEGSGSTFRSQDNAGIKIPYVAIATPAAGALDMNSGAAGTSTLRTALATRHEAAATPVAVRLTDGSAFLTAIPTVSVGYEGTATVTRGANVTAYSINDVIGGALTIANIGPASSHIIITSIDLIMNITALPAGITGPFTLYLYNVTPPSAVADNAAFTLPSGDRASCLTPLGISLGIPALAQGGGSVVCQVNNVYQQYVTGSGSSLFAYLVCSTAFTPAANSETYTLRVRTVTI